MSPGGYGSKEWANSLLQFAIDHLKGPGSFCQRVDSALFLRELLLQAGCWWQAKIVLIHIRRLQRGELAVGSDPTGELMLKEPTGGAKIH